MESAQRYPKFVLRFKNAYLEFPKRGPLIEIPWVIAEAVPSNIRSALQSPVVLVSNNTTTIFIHIFINDNFSPHLNIFHCLY